MTVAQQLTPRLDTGPPSPVLWLIASSFHAIGSDVAINLVACFLTRKHGIDLRAKCRCKSGVKVIDEDI